MLVTNRTLSSDGVDADITIVIAIFIVLSLVCLNRLLIFVLLW